MSQSQPTSHHIQANGLRLHHLDWGGESRNGDQNTVVVLHGIRLHAHVWEDFCRRFRGQHHILTLDQRGHGDSGWSQEHAYSLHEYYEDLKAVVAARGLTRFTLLGHSLGARVSLLYTHLHPEQVQRLVLVDMGAGLPRALEQADFSRVTETPPPREFSSEQEAVDYVSAILKQGPRELMEYSVLHGLRRLENGNYTWKYDPALGGAPQPRAGTREWDLWEAARGIACPTLLLHGEHSQVVTPEIVQRMSEVMTDCRPELVRNAGHALFSDQPEAFAQSVERFFRDTHESAQ